MWLIFVSSASRGQAVTLGPKVPTVNPIVRLPIVTQGPPGKQRRSYRAGHFKDLVITFWEPRTKTKPLYKINPLLHTTAHN